MHDAHDHGIGPAECEQPERTTTECGGQEGVERLNESERALLAEIASMAMRLCEEVKSMRADIAELSESLSPDAAAPSALQRPA